MNLNPIIKYLSRVYFLLAVVLLFSQCRTYQYKNRQYQAELKNYNFDKADKELDHNKYLKKKRNEVLYAFEKGKVAHLKGNYEESNKYFNQVDLYAEDYKKDLKDYTVELIANAELQGYKVEDFEGVLIHYYKSLNYIYLNDFEAALVEAKRINLKLQAINDKYKKDKNKYAKDAFGHILMGVIYELDGDVNNAFIAYRNAYEIYKESEGTYLNVKTPLQLKKDILKTAYLNGFKNDLQFYEREFGISMDSIPQNEVVLFWENGLSPVKDEWSINFTVIPGADGLMFFENKELDLSFSFQVDKEEDEETKLSDLRLVRVAFPKYEDRLSYYSTIEVSVNNKTYQVELVEDLNTISRETLQDRFVREMSFSLLRLFLKQSSEMALREENEELGAVLSIVNAVTEKADTRQWQSLPEMIYYTRIPLSSANTSLNLKLIGRDGITTKRELVIPNSNKKMKVVNFHSLETIDAY